MQRKVRKIHNASGPYCQYNKGSSFLTPTAFTQIMRFVFHLFWPDSAKCWVLLIRCWALTFLVGIKLLRALKCLEGSSDEYAFFSHKVIQLHFEYWQKCCLFKRKPGVTSVCIAEILLLRLGMHIQEIKHQNPVTSVSNHLSLWNREICFMSQAVRLQSHSLTPPPGLDALRK